jgi:hypothetical protein
MKDKNLLCTTELVSILTSIALKNPEIYQTFASILSTIICNLNENKKQKIIELIVNKFKITNNCFLKSFCC